ncbi:hypothetical protein GGR56DRAFT_392086 [Xylariaceae sp. FL0804]|nr:hypothetical protein GGR56DRAFT_392086 [Xylariaceae sp. FL0804]
MGNTHGKESRSSPRMGGGGSNADAGGSSRGAGSHHDRPDRSGRVSRSELAALGLTLGSSSGSRQQQDAPFERRETRQEREARKLERERAARLKERERSMKEEHVDGGYLVTMGIYTASEDFSKPVVRQLQIERKIAPFWRGLDDFNESWAEHQIVAAARGLEIPPADVVPEHLVPQPRLAESPGASNPNISNLTVPIGSRTLSTSSDNTASNPPSALPSPTSATASGATRIGSQLKTPKKALAAALSLSRNSSHTDIAPREISLPHDPMVNGQPLEVFLYKAGEECPVCIMYYPPYMNRTRCCSQLICSECFVQIKRPDPHLPEHHVEEPRPEPQPAQEAANGELVMEPAKCPYCTQSDFGVTYEPPPFRRGLAYAFNPPMLDAMGTAMSSSSSLNSALSPTLGAPSSAANRKRSQSLSANAAGVITTDRIRPDWTVKLASARAHSRRRAAAADALHHAAFVMGNPEPRSLFRRPGPFGRRSAARDPDSPSGSANPLGADGAGETSGPEPGPRTSSGRRGPGERIDAAHLESLMMAEAIRLSLADEEERRKKEEKEARKEAKKRDKEERKAAKKRGEVYGGGSSASASSLSLGLGRRRGNSGASNLRMEASVAAATASTAGQGTGATGTQAGAGAGTGSSGKGKEVDRGEGGDGVSSASGASSLPIPTPSQGPRSSHLRQMSNASSVSSSGLDSMPGSFGGRNLATEDARVSDPDLGSSAEDGGDSASQEPLFNFRSLAEMVGVPIDGEDGGPEGQGAEAAKTGEAHGEHVEHADEAQPERDNEKREPPPRLETEAAATETRAGNGGSPQPPQLMITPETPAPGDEADEGSKQLGHFGTAEQTREVSQ